MAEARGQQGTGKHPHKSAEDPTPHHEAPSTKEKDAQASGSHSNGGKSSGSHESESKSAGSHRGEESNDSSDLKSREYTDKDGNVHHHTRAKAEQSK